MHYEVQGDHAQDPLFRLLCQEGEFEEAVSYANSHMSLLAQHNLKVEREDTKEEFGADSDIHIDKLSTELNSVPDREVTALVALKKRRNKMAKKSKLAEEVKQQGIGHVTSHMPEIVPDMERPIDAAVQALINKRLNIKENHHGKQG